MKRLRLSKLLHFSICIGISGFCGAAEKNLTLETLGERVFSDPRFSNPAGDLRTSCASCHVPSDPSGRNAYSDVFSRSWQPWRKEDPVRETLRNAPQLLDVGTQTGPLHLDGQFSSIEELARKKLTGRLLGWLPNEEQLALKYIRAVISKDKHYAVQFKKVFGKPIDSLNNQTVVELMAKALDGFMIALNSQMNSPYDRFVEENRLPAKPDENETPQRYGVRVLKEIERLERKDAIQFTDGFDETALRGYKLFLETEKFEQRGNCVSCHVPPHFSDFSFHNTGVTQIEYDALHGAGSFKILEIPEGPDSAQDNRFKKLPSTKNKNHVDLGHWNFADAETSPVYIGGDSQRSFFRRTVATFKTPTLRHLGSTSPFTHSGDSPLLHDVLDKKTFAAFLTRMAQMRNPDLEMANIFIYEDDYDDLYAFLNTLNDAKEPLAEAPPQRPNPFDASSYTSSYQR